MSAVIYYFSGTGNSLHVARELERRIPESTLSPIVCLLRRQRIEPEAESVGFVFPNFCMTLPIPFLDFLQKIDLAAAGYLFAVCTRGGTTSDEAFAYLDQLLQKQGRRLDAQLSITMPWNAPIGKENLTGEATEERVTQLEAVMHEKLDLFSERVLAQEAYVPPDTDAGYDVPAWARLIYALLPKSLNYGLHRRLYQNVVCFYSDRACVGCGTCQEVCLSGKIELVDGRPVWSDSIECYACFACINFCPRQAIQVESRFPIESHTEETARYHHPSVTPREIAEQK